MVAFSPAQPPKVARRLLFPHASGANFDAIVAFDPAATLEDPTRTYLQVTNGAFAGRYIPLATAGISADIHADQAVSTTTAAPPTQPPLVSVGTDGGALAAAILEGRRQEWDRIAQSLAGLNFLPPRP